MRRRPGGVHVRVCVPRCAPKLQEEFGCVIVVSVFVSSHHLIDHHEPLALIGESEL
jgi:hypothetical protein